MSGKPKGFCDNWVVTKKGTVLDTYFSGESQVKNDTKNDFTWTYFSSNTSYLVGEFDRLLVTGDNRDYDITPGTGQGLIWAGAKSFSGTKYPYHDANFGSSFVDFGAPTSCDAPSTPGGFSSSIGIKVTWTLDDAKTMINFTMSYNNAGSGWIAIGISSTPLMTNSDMYSGWITNNVVTLYDGWCTSQTVPAADVTSNIIPGSVSGSVVAGLTTISFSRLLNTGDAKDYTITSSPAALMVAWGTCSTGCSVGSYPKHTAYDSTFVNFLSTNGSAPPPAPDGVIVPNDPSKDPVGTTLSNADGSFTVTYQIVGDKIIFKMVATTTGWISIGFSGGKMCPADMYVGWVYPDGRVHFKDQWADSYLVSPVDDAQQDATLLSAYEANGKTSITFSRPCTTTDTKDTSIYDPDVTRIIWALSPMDGSAYSYPKHSADGSIGVDFLAGPPGSPSSAPASAPANEWIDSRKRFYVSWKITDADATITFNVTVKTTGWISIAFGPATATSSITMLGLDAIVAWIDPSGTAYAKDCICDSSSRILPIVDTTDNILSFSGSQANGYTSIIFTRKLDTGDAQDYPITNVALVVAVAWAPTLPSSYSKRDAQVLTYDVHSAWDATKLNLFSTTPLPPPPSGAVVNNTVNSTAPRGNNQYSNGQFKVSYEIDASETWVTFLMSAHSLGWISIGLNSENKKMKPADTYTGWITDGQVYFYDELSNSYGQPTKDTSQDAVVLAAEEIDGWTTIVFKRKLITGDKDNDVDLYKTEFIIFASGPEDGSSTGNYPEHDYYGSKAIDFSLANGFAAVDPGYMLTAGDILLIIMFVVMIVWGLIRLIAVLIKRSHYSSYQFDQPAATYTNVQQLYQQMDNAVDQQNEVEMVENAPREASGVEFHAGHYDGNTYVRLSPEERAGGLKLKHDSGVVASVKGILEYRFHSTQVALGDVIAFTIFIGFNAAAFFLTKAEEWNTINGAAISLGSLVGGNAVFIVMFATRHSALVYLLGIPFDRAILFHRWLGRWSGIVLFLHFIFESIFFSQNLPAGSNDTAISVVAKEWVDNEGAIGEVTLNLYGFLSAIFYIIIFVFSLEWFRRNKFEIFFASHALILGFFALGALHTPKFRLYAYISAALFIIDILLRIFLSSIIIPRKTTVFKKRSDTLVQVRFPKQVPWAKPFYKPGQYVFVNFPDISRAEWHPFSVTSAPDDEEIEINIRALGNWTRKVAALAAESNRVWVRCDGPYGNLDLNYHRYTSLLLVAGGIGITPVIGILKDIFTAKKKKRSRLETVVMVWSVPSNNEGEWFMDDFRHLMNVAQHASIKLDLRIHVTRAAKDAPPPSPPMYNGRPDMEKLLDQCTDHRAPCFVFVCGPRKMVNATWDLATGFQRKGKIVHFHHETFEF